MPDSTFIRKNFVVVSARGSLVAEEMDFIELFHVLQAESLVPAVREHLCELYMAKANS